MRILLLSAYDAGSHRRWREQLVEALCEHDWEVLTLSARHFRWRIRGNPLSWWGEQALAQQWDLLIATSAVDLAALRGIAPALAAVPAALYCHENQFAYPRSAAQHSSIEPQMVNLYSLLAADRVVFNSEWNRKSCLLGVETLLARFPDALPAGVVPALRRRSTVLPVGLAPDSFRPASRFTPAPLELLWNHRWEYDKGPEVLPAMVSALLQAGVHFRLHIVGEQFRRRPQAFDTLCERFPQILGTWGWLPRREYRALLARCHVVLSTAWHEFQGLAVLEAVAAGCVPLVPDRLCYPEQFGPRYRYCGEGDPERQGRALAAQLQQWAAVGLPQCPDVSAWGWDVLAPRYRALLAELHRDGRDQPRERPVS